MGANIMVRSVWGLDREKVQPTKDKGVEVIGETSVRGDIIANGLTILDWRMQAYNSQIPLFRQGYG